MGEEFIPFETIDPDFLEWPLVVHAKGETACCLSVFSPSDSGRRMGLAR